MNRGAGTKGPDRAREFHGPKDSSSAAPNLSAESLAATNEPRLERCNLNQLTGKIRNEFAERIVALKVRVLYRFSEPAPEVLIDSISLEQVIKHILGDLLDQVPRGGRLKIETRQSGKITHLILAADGGRSPGATVEALLNTLADPTDPRREPNLELAYKLVRDAGVEIGVRADSDWPKLHVLCFRRQPVA